jgi:uncharacterized membrane protein
LGWGGAFALVLAATYLIRLAIDHGWLTPVRQVGLATLSGFVLVAAGFFLRGINRTYAGLLPAGGVVVLFLSVYGAHLYYGLLDAKTAAGAVAVICIGSLWLCRRFESDLYALFAVVGSYLAPVLLRGLPVSPVDLAIYFSAWSIVFSVFAVWHRRRMIYLVALYLALLVFDFAWRQQAGAPWLSAFAFQSFQFLIFGCATVMYSIRRRDPLDVSAALAHLPALLLFYALQYTLLREHVPALAPWIAVASATVVSLLYWIARVQLARPLPGGELLLWCYIALVLFHAGYLETVSDDWAPWVAFVLMPMVAVMSLRRGAVMPLWPLWAVVVLIFAMNYLRVVFDSNLEPVFAHRLLAIAYALQLYAGYYLGRTSKLMPDTALLVLYAGHVAAMSAAAQWLTEPLFASVAWGLLAIGCLVYARVRGDRAVGQSSLLVFGATAAKVMLFDLSGAAPLARIVSLAVLGVTFYFGGLLYQRIQEVQHG